MIVTPAGRLAQRLALGVPALLLGGAYLSQYGFGLHPCEMCWWQRYPHFAALALALVSTVVEPKRLWVALAALAILSSGAIGAFHAGVEYGWWQGVTGCTAAPGAGTGDALENILAAPIIRCDVAPWSLFGVSLAGWNFIVSTLGALAIGWLLLRDRRAA
ncbi:disulfide bond formation protein B [Leptolyngbya sp. 15MV]|nr:disulfide bond formation protein B [Leptolyngbya sp. 15MV]